MDNLGLPSMDNELPTEHEMAMEIYTPYHRITGTVVTTARRTNGVMNSLGDYLMMDRVTAGSLLRPSDPPIESRIARINKDTIVLAVPNEEAENDRFVRRARLSTYMLQRRVLLGLGNFEISGNLHLEHELELATVLLNRPEIFIGVTDATIFYMPNPGLRFSSNTVLINKNFVGFICAGAP